MTGATTGAKLAATKFIASRAPALALADRVVGMARGRREVDDERRNSMARQPRSIRRASRMAALALPTARDLEQEIETRTVDDPIEAGAKLSVATNRRVDILEHERAHERISQAAYLTGREVQRTFEQAQAGGGGSNWSGGDRVDMELAKERMIVRGVDRARAVQVEMKRLCDAVGEIGARFLREILAEGTTFKQYAERRGRGGDRGTAYVADRFRAQLEELAEFRAARGRAG